MGKIGIDPDRFAPQNVEDFNNLRSDMATVNFSVPEDVKRAFDETFAGRNKSAILTGLMREAVADARRRQRRAEAARAILEERDASGPVSATRLDEARRAGRP